MGDLGQLGREGTCRERRWGDPKVGGLALTWRRDKTERAGWWGFAVP